MLFPPEFQLSQAIEQAGLRVPHQISFDGEIHRFSSDGTREDLSGWYVAFADGIPAGAFGTWKEDIKHQWRADIGRELTTVEAMIVADRLRKAAEIRDRQRVQKNQAAAETCQRIWEEAEADPENHPYLKRKQVGAHGVKISKEGRLILPLFTSEGELSSLQYIAESGKKKFHPGGKAGGCFWWIGDITASSRVYIAEGYATAASIHETSGVPVIIAYNAKNLVSVSSAIREMLPTAKLIIVADNDESGTGKKCADEAAEKSGAEVILPPETGDANDYLLSGGDLEGLLDPVVSTWLEPASSYRMNPKPVRWLIKHWLQDNALVMVHGPSGCGKTFVVLDWSLRIASEDMDSWCGEIVHHGSVVYLAGEGHAGLRQRYAAWYQHHQLEKDPDLWFSSSGTDLNTPEGLQKAITAISEAEIIPRLIVVDTLHRFLRGDENSSQDTKTMLDSCATLMQLYSCSVLLVHHTGVSSEAQHRARGSSSWRGALENEISVEKKHHSESIRVIDRKTKDGKDSDDKYLDLTEVIIKGWLDEDGDPVSSAVVTEGVVPSQQQRDAKQQERINDMMQAWMNSGAEDIDGIPYLTKSAWKDYLKGMNPDIKEGTLSQRFKVSDSRSMISRLMAEGLIQEFRAGYQVIDGEVSSIMLLTRFGSIGSTTVGIPKTTR